MPIDRVGTVCVFVGDKDRAKKFYTNVLGFQLHDDQPLAPGAANRWISVVPKGAETKIILYLPDQNREHYKEGVGKSQAISPNVTDMPSLHKELKAKGVKFVQEPDPQPWGTYATIEDSEGNHLILVEPPKRS